MSIKRAITELNDPQKDTILNGEIRGIVAEETPEQALKRHEQLAAEYGVTLGQVASTAAYARYRATSVLKKYDLEGVLESDDVVVAWDYEMSDSQDEAEYRIAAITKYFSERAGETLAKSKARDLIADYQRREDGYRCRRRGVRLSQPQVSKEVPVVAPFALITDDTDAVNHFATDAQGGEPDNIDSDEATELEPEIIIDEQGRRISGEDVDYNNEMKNKWRRKLAEFIAKHTSPERRKEMKVLCLPGKECLEIPVYLELGFSPENIVGVEGGKKATRAVFEANARQYGIDFRLGKLEKVLPREKTIFDVVSLDFHGHFAEVHLRILQHLLLSDNALVLINSRKGRENPEMQMIFRNNYALFGDDSGNSNLHWEDKEKIIDRVESNQVAIELHKARHAILTELICRYLGTCRLENYKVPADLTEYWIEDRCTAISDIVDELEHFLCLRRFSNKEDARKSAAQLHALFHGGTTNHSQPIELEQYEYVSDTGSAFLSEFIVFNRPSQLYFNARRTIQFVAACVEERVQQMRIGTGAKGKFILKDKQLLPRESFASKSDILSYAVGERTVASIRFGTFAEDMQTQCKIYNSQIWSSEMNIRKSLDQDYEIGGHGS